MGMTIAEKVLARASDQRSVRPGQIVDAKLDRVVVTEEFYRMHAEAIAAGLEGIPRIWDIERFYVVLEHFQPAIRQEQASRQKSIRELVKKYGIKHFQDAVCGVFHQIAVEDYVLPGELALGSDSHSCTWGAVNCVSTGMAEQELTYAVTHGKIWFKVPETIKVTLYGNLPRWVQAKDIFLYLAGKYSAELGLYKSIEFTGDAVAELSMDSRLCLSAQSLELGAKFALFNYDTKTAEFLSSRPGSKRQLDLVTPVSADPDAHYAQEIMVDLHDMEPLVAIPHNFEKIVPAATLAGIKIDQAVVGSCANGRVEDIAAVVRIVKGKKVNSKTRFFVQPASWSVYRECMAKGYISNLLDAGVQVLAPGCHLCLGMQGKLAEDEVCLSSTTRNFKGRMGSTESKIFLASPKTVAASALRGFIVDPRSED